MKYDGILFDLDGTLWNATKAIQTSWQTALKDIPDVPAPPTVQQLERVMGMAAEELMATLFPSLSSQRRAELFEHCCQVQNDYLRYHGGELYENVAETLQKLSQKLPLFIVSNCNNGYISCFLEAHQLRPYFQDWECVGKTGLPKSENIRLVVKRNHLSSPVYVGDTQLDQQSAKQAKVPFIHAAYGFGKVSCETKIEKLADLLALV